MLKKIYLSKHKNGNYYIYYFDKRGKYNCTSTKTKIKSEALVVLSEFSKTLEQKFSEEVVPKKISEFEREFLIYSETYHCWRHTLDYKTTFKSLIKHFGDKQLSEFTQNEIEVYIQGIIRNTSLHAGRKYLINIKAMFNRAVVLKYMKKNPAQLIKRIKIPEKLPIFFSREEFNKLLNAAEHLDWKDIIEFAVNTGLRQMEILTLVKRQFNEVDKFIILDNNEHITKSKKIRMIPLNTKAFEIIKRRVASQKSELIFTLDGNIILQDHLVHKFKEFVRKAELNDGLRFHSLRHTFASWLVQAGVSIYEVSKLLGHSDVKTTQIYAHLRNDDLRNAVQAINLQ